MFSKKTTNYDTKISKIERKVSDHNHNKYITSTEFNEFTADVFDERLKWANFVINKFWYQTK